MKTIEKVCDFEGNIRLDVFVAEMQISGIINHGVSSI